MTGQSETVVKSGVRALDWREAVHVPIEPGMVEWKLYLRLFDDIDGEFEGQADTGLPRVGVPFLRIGLDDGGRALVLRADPTAEPLGGYRRKSFPPPSYGGG